MTAIGIVLIVGGVWMLLALIGRPVLHRWLNIETEATLRQYEEFKKARDREFPEMIGKWSKP